MGYFMVSTQGLRAPERVPLQHGRCGDSGIHLRAHSRTIYNSQSSSRHDFDGCTVQNFWPTKLSAKPCCGCHWFPFKVWLFSYGKLYKAILFIIKFHIARIWNFIVNVLYNFITKDSFHSWVSTKGLENDRQSMYANSNTLWFNLPICKA